jgi:FAD synthetase
LLICSFHSLSLSFNGGKDCTVLFHLINIILTKQNKTWNEILIIYFKQKYAFQQMETFMNTLSSKYGCKYYLIDSSFRDGLFEVTEKYELKGIFMGQRNGDPGAKGLQKVNKINTDQQIFTN